MRVGRVLGEAILNTSKLCSVLSGCGGGGDKIQIVKK